MGKFKVKTLFHGWISLKKEKAVSYANYLINGITALSDKEKATYINRRIKGLMIDYRGHGWKIITKGEEK